jgi:hypothetical protein
MAPPLRYADLVPCHPQHDLSIVHVLANRPFSDPALRSCCCPIRSQIRCAVCRCFRGALRSPSRIASINSTAILSFHLGRSAFFRGLGTALPIASRTIRRCTPTFLATPAIVPIPNSYSRRICSNNSTFALQSNESPLFGLRPNQSTRSSWRVGHIKPPNWAESDYRNQTSQQKRPPPSREDPAGSKAGTRRRSTAPACVCRLVEPRGSSTAFLRSGSR